MSPRELIRLLPWCAALLACAGAPTTPDARQYDLGPPPAAAAVPAEGGVRLVAVHAPLWLDSTGISYRLDFQDAYRRERYRDSRWVAPPADLIAARLRAALPSPRSDRPAPLLSLELEECEQRFADPGHATVVLRLAATLTAPGALPAGAGRRERFEVEVPSPTPDAQGAVKGTALAADMVVMRLASWLSRAEAP